MCCKFGMRGARAAQTLRLLKCGTHHRHLAEQTRRRDGGDHHQDTHLQCPRDGCVVESRDDQSRVGNYKWSGRCGAPLGARGSSRTNVVMFGSRSRQYCMLMIVHIDSRHSDSISRGRRDGLGERLRCSYTPPSAVRGPAAPKAEAAPGAPPRRRDDAAAAAAVDADAADPAPPLRPSVMGTAAYAASRPPLASLPAGRR